LRKLPMRFHVIGPNYQWACRGPWFPARRYGVKRMQTSDNALSVDASGNTAPNKTDLS